MRLKRWFAIGAISLFCSAASPAFAANIFGDAIMGFLYTENAFSTITTTDEWLPDIRITSDGQINFSGSNGSGSIFTLSSIQPALFTEGLLTSGSTSTVISDPLTNSNTYVNYVNNLGQVVGSYLDDTGHQNGFIYSNGIYTTINSPFGYGTILSSINDAGEIVGFADAAGNMTPGFVYFNGVFTAFNDPLATQTIPTAINNAGEIVGYYYPSSVPEPASWALMLIGFGAIGFAMRGSPRRQRVAA